MRRGIALTFAIGALAAMPAPAFAADEIDWGFRHQFRAYVYGGTGMPPITASAGATCEPNPDAVRGGCDPKINQATPGAFDWTAATASYDTSGNGTITSFGRAVFNRPDHFFKLTLEDPDFVIANDDELTVNARFILESTFPSIPTKDERLKLGTFTVTDFTDDGTTATWQTGVGASSQEFADSTDNLLAPGSELDPIAITIPKDFTPPDPPVDPPPADPINPPGGGSTGQSLTPPVQTLPDLPKLTAKVAGKKSKKAKRKVKLTLSRELIDGDVVQKLKLRKGKRVVATGTVKGTSVSLTVKKRKGKYPRIKGKYTLAPGKGATFAVVPISVT